MVSGLRQAVNQASGMPTKNPAICIFLDIYKNRKI